MVTKTRAKPATAKPATVKTAKTTNIVPLGDRVVVRQMKMEERRASGLVIPDTAVEKPQLGQIVAVGPGRIDDNGKRHALDVKVGDRVLFAKYSGQEVPKMVLGTQEEELLVLKESDILAKVV